jgi:VCBS repeat-containing protein
LSNGTTGTSPSGNVLTNESDVDSVDNGETKAVTGVSAGAQVNAAGSVGSSVIGTYGSITIGANGAYTYAVDNTNATVQALRTTANTLSDVFTYTMRDTAGLTSTTQITVTIQGANDAPSDITGTLTIAENSANSTVVGTVGTTDIDNGDTFTYSLTNNAGGRFAINSSTGQVTVANGSLLNFEASSSHTIVVQTTDAAGAGFSKTMNVTVTNVNEAPTAITYGNVAADYRDDFRPDAPLVTGWQYLWNAPSGWTAGGSNNSSNPYTSSS